MRFLLTTSACAFILAGCAVGPDYERNMPDTAQSWFSSERAEAVIDESQAVQTEWWSTLSDPVLAHMIEKTAAHNLDVKIAEANIREARANRRVQRAGFFPGIDSDASAQRQGISENIGQPINADNPANREFYNAGFDASYELDIFGGVRRSVEAADARLSSAEENRRDILLTALAETARNYADLRGTQRRIAITKKNIGLQRKTLQIAQRRYDVGEANDFELARAEAQLQITESLLPNLTADLRSNAYRLGVLTGQEPQALLGELLQQKPLPAPPDIVPVGLRSDILQRRPDIRRAERELAAATADIGVATSDLFPKFFLTGNAGVESLSFSTLFESTSTAWALGPFIQWPVFRGGEIRARIKAEEAQAEAAALEYERAVLTALEDAENALVRYGEELETRKRLQKAVASNERAVALAKRRYEGGVDDITALIDAERELAGVEDDLVQSETRVITNLIALYKALGGGWEAFEN